MAEFDNIAGIMANSKPLPTYAEQQAQANQAQYYGAEAARTQTQNQQLQYQNQMARYQFARQQGYIQDAHTMSHQQLAEKYPDMVAQIKSNFDAMHEINQTQTRTMLGSAVSLAQGGHYTDAADYLDQQHQLAQQAGQEDEFSPYVTQLLRSSNPADQAAGKRMLAHTLLSTYDQKEAPANAKALGISEEPTIIKPGETAENQLMGSQVVAPLAKTSIILKNRDGSESGGAFDPNPSGYGSTPGGLSGAPGADVGAAPPSTGTVPATPGQGSADASGLTGIIHNIESGGLGDYGPDGKPLTNKKSGARFGMQVMPATAAKPGYGVKPAASNTAAEFNRVGTQLFQAHLDHYGDPLKAAAAYQAGRGNLNKAMVAAAKAGDPNNWVNYLGPDGRKYVHDFATQMASLGGQGGTQVASNGPLEVPQGAPVQMAANGAPASSSGLYMGPQAGSSPIVMTNANPQQGVDTAGAQPGYQWTPGRTGQVPIKGTAEDFAGQDPTSKEAQFREYALNGTLPQFTGTSGAGYKNGFLAEFGPWLASHNMTPQQLVGMRAQYNVDRGAFNTAYQTAATMKTAKAQLDEDGAALIKTHKALVDAGIIGNTPSINDAKLTLYSHVGSPQTQTLIKQYFDSLGAYKAKVAKFLSSANGAGGNAAPTEGAANRAAELNDEGINHTALIGHIHQYMIETGNALGPMIDTANTYKKKLDNYLPNKGQAAAPGLPQGAHWIGTSGGKNVYKLPNGSRIIEQ